MKTILLFPKIHWSKDKIVETIGAIGLTIHSKQLRLGFNHIVLITSEEIDFALVKSKESIIVVRYNQDSQSLDKMGYIIENDELKELDVENEINNDKTNFVWDIKNFGFIPKGTSDFKTTIQNIKRGHQEPIINILNEFTCEDLVDNEQIPVEVRKLLVDIYALRAASFEIQKLAFSSFNKINFDENYTKYYATLLSCTFITRSIIDKLIQVIAILDPSIDFKILQGSKSFKRTFKKMAERSDHPLTTELLHFISNIEILDDNYRTPEVHKMSRLIGLLNTDPKEAFGTLINELLGYFNWTTQFYKKICDQWRDVK